MNILLWVLQVLLAALFVFAGGSKLVMSIEEMTRDMPLPSPLGGGFLRFIGIAELLGGLGLVLPGLVLPGLVLPGLFRIRPGLTPLAAVGLIVIMIGATVLTLAMAGVKSALIPFVVGILLAFVAYQRARRPV